MGSPIVSFTVKSVLANLAQGACKQAGSELMSQLLAMIWPTPPDPVLGELTEISSQLYAINGSIQALNALVGWDFEIAQATNNQENINYYYNQLGNNAPSPAVPPTPFDQWPTLYATITGFSPIGQPTNSGMYYWASQLHDLYMGANVSGGTGSGMIATAVCYAIQQCQMNAQNYIPPWQATQWVKNFMLQITVNQFQAIAALNNAYVFGQNNGASQADLETIQNQMSEISNNVWGNPPNNNGVPQSQWAQYQACMPVWLQTLDSLSQVSGPSSDNPAIGWTNDNNQDSYTPSGFSCVIGYPGNDPGLYAVQSPSYGGDLSQDPSYNQPYGFPVGGILGKDVEYAPAISLYVALDSPGPVSKSTYFNLFPVAADAPAGGNGFWMQNPANGTALNPLAYPPDDVGTWSTPTLGTPSTGAAIWVCPSFASAPVSAPSYWREIVNIYMTPPGTQQSLQFQAFPPFTTCVNQPGGTGDSQYGRLPSIAPCPSSYGLVSLAGPVGENQFTQCFLIQLAPPALSLEQTIGGQPLTAAWVPDLVTIAPNSGQQGDSVAITLTGVNLIGAVVNPLSGIATSAVTANSAGTQATVTFVIAGNAPSGPQNVFVSTPGGFSTNIEPFTVTPYLQSITLADGETAAGAPGDSVPVILTGVGIGISGVTVLVQEGISPQDVTVVSSAEVTATFVIDNDLAPGPYQVSVSASEPTMCNELPFAVTPTLFSISPLMCSPGDTDVDVTLTGVGLTNATVNVPEGISFTQSGQASNTQITGQLTLTNPDLQGAQSIKVSVAGAASNSVAFYVGPLLLSIIPQGAAPGSSGTVIVTGYSLGSTSEVPAFNPAQGVTWNPGNPPPTTQVNGPLSGTGTMQACATFTVDSGAATGPVSVTLSLDGIQSNAVQFYIQPAPSLTSILQSTETQGSVCDVTLIGENLLLAVINAPPGVTVSYVVALATEVAATFIIAADAPTGAQNVSVTTPSGTSGNVTFTVTEA